jgi:hypothetical protein
MSVGFPRLPVRGAFEGFAAFVDGGLSERAGDSYFAAAAGAVELAAELIGDGGSHAEHGGAFRFLRGERAVGSDRRFFDHEREIGFLSRASITSW